MQAMTCMVVACKQCDTIHVNVLSLSVLRGQIRYQWQGNRMRACNAPSNDVCGTALLGCDTRVHRVWFRIARMQHSTLDARQVAAHEQCWYHMTQLLRLDSSQVVRRRTLATLGDIAALRHVSGRAAPDHSVTFAQKQNFAPRAPKTECLMDLEVGGRRF